TSNSPTGTASCAAFVFPPLQRLEQRKAVGQLGLVVDNRRSGHDLMPRTVARSRATRRSGHADDAIEIPDAQPESDPEDDARHRPENGVDDDSFYPVARRGCPR